MVNYYDRDGQPMDMMTWALSMEKNQRVSSTTVGDVRVSTVWLGIDHSFGHGPPLIFETMIFGGPHDQEQWRYSTLEQAETGHLTACELAFEGKES